MAYEDRPNESPEHLDFDIDEKFISELLVEYNRGEFEALITDFEIDSSKMHPVFLRYVVRMPSQEIGVVELTRGLHKSEAERMSQNLDLEQVTFTQNYFEGVDILGGYGDIMMQMAAAEAKDHYYRILGGMIILQHENPAFSEQTIVTFPEFYRDLIQRYGNELSAETTAVNATVNLEDDAFSQRQASAYLALSLLNTFYSPERTRRIALQ